MKEIHILLLGILFSLVFVVPQADHLYGIDTIRNYELSNDIAKRGHIYWSMTPFSVIGFEPASYPVGGLVLLSEISLILNVDLEITILIISILLNLFMFILAYSIGKNIFKNIYYAIMLAIIFTTSRLFIHFTTWNYSVRIIIILFIITIFLILLKILDDAKKIKHYFLIILLCAVMILTHRMSGIIIIYIIGFLITLMISKYAKSLKEKKVLLVIITLGVLLYIVFYLILNFGVVDERVYINSTRVSCDKNKTGCGRLTRLLEKIFLSSLSSSEKSNKDIFFSSMFSLVSFFFIFYPLF